MITSSVSQPPVQFANQIYRPTWNTASTKLFQRLPARPTSHRAILGDSLFSTADPVRNQHDRSSVPVAFVMETSRRPLHPRSGWTTADWQCKADLPERDEVTRPGRRCASARARRRPRVSKVPQGETARETAGRKEGRIAEIPVRGVRARRAESRPPAASRGL